MSNPKVTVFIPVYNRAEVVGTAIDSVLAQSFGDFELLVIDDGSADASPDVVRSYTDARVRLVVHEKNLGTPRTRNHGLDLAKGRYIALLDSDDYAYPERLARQVRFLDANPSIAAVGSWAIRTDRAGRARTALVRPTDPREIRAHILFISCFKNPTMTARTDVLREFRYREQFTICQDIDLWARISAKWPLANLPAFLVRYRGGGSSHGDESRTRAMRMAIVRDQLAELAVDVQEDDVVLHERLRNLRGFRPDAATLARIGRWLERLVEANRKAGAYPEPEFTRAAAGRWALANLAAAFAGVAPQALRPSPLRAGIPTAFTSYLTLGRRYLGERFGLRGAA